MNIKLRQVARVVWLFIGGINLYRMITDYETDSAAMTAIHAGMVILSLFFAAVYSLTLRKE